MYVYNYIYIYKSSFDLILQNKLKIFNLFVFIYFLSYVILKKIILKKRIIKLNFMIINIQFAINK